MRLEQMSKAGVFAHYWLKAENRRDMLDLRNLRKDIQEAKRSTLDVPVITLGDEVADDTGEQLPTKIELLVQPEQ